MNSAMKINTKTKVHIGGTLKESAARILENVARHERGESVDEKHLTFQNWQALFNVLTPKRYELLQHIHRHPEPSVRALSRALDRDFKRVYEDVKALVEAGLLEHDAEGLRAEYEAIETAIPL